MPFWIGFPYYTTIWGDLGWGRYKLPRHHVSYLWHRQFWRKQIREMDFIWKALRWSYWASDGLGILPDSWAHDSVGRLPYIPSSLVPNTVDGRNPANQLRLVVYPIIYRVLYIPGGAGLLPSTVSLPLKKSAVHHFGGPQENFSFSR